MSHSRMAAAALTFVLLFGSAVASAHHHPEHQVVAVGVPSRLALEFPVCDTEKQLVEIVAAHALHGFDTAKGVFSRLGNQKNDKGEPLCGMASVPIVVDSIIAESIDLNYPSGKSAVTLVRLHVPGKPDVRGAAALSIKVLPADKAHMLDLFASF